jgi:hypothetical protein
MNPRLNCFLLSCACAATCSAKISPADTRQASIEDVSNRAQLFIDGRFIASSTNVHLVMNRPRLAGPVLEPGPPGSWDDSRITWGTVVEDEGLFKMWAGGVSAQVTKGDWKVLEVHRPLGYATSKDGIHWNKPKVGLYRWGGNRDNNIVCLDCGAVFVDPRGPPDARYKLLCQAMSQIGAKTLFDALDPVKGGLHFYTSPDGIHWKWNPDRLLPFVPDTLNQVVYDNRIHKYVAYLRTWPKGFLFGKTYGRAVGRIEMDDVHAPWPYEAGVRPFKPWGTNYIRASGKEVPTVFSFPGFDHEGVWTDVYNPCVSIYPRAQDVYLAFPSINHYLPDSSLPNDSTLSVGMVVSRDGIHWTWPSLEPYIPQGPAGSGRSGQLYSQVGLLKVDDEIYQYHAATDFRHNSNLGTDYTLEQLRGASRIFRTVQRLDGFVSADFADAGGELITPPLSFSGKYLRLNIDATKGQGQVELLDADGNPIPGFELAACRKITSNSVRQPVSWKDRSDLSTLKGRPSRIRFQMPGVKLYAFQFAN